MLKNKNKKNWSSIEIGTNCKDRKKNDRTK